MKNKVSSLMIQTFIENNLKFHAKTTYIKAFIIAFDMKMH